MANEMGAGTRHHADLNKPMGWIVCLFTVGLLLVVRYWLVVQPKPYAPINRPIPNGTLLYTYGEGVYRCDLPSLKPIKLDWPDSIGGGPFFLSGPYRGVLACEYYLGNSYVLRKDPKHAQKCIVVKDLGNVTSPTVSPDGNLVAYHGPAATEGRSLHLYDLRTGKDILLSNSANGCPLSWSADSQELTCGLWVPRSQLPSYRSDASTQDYQNGQDVSVIGVMTVRSKEFRPIVLGFDARLAGDGKSVWMENSITDPDSQERFMLSGKRAKGSRLKISIANILGWVGPDLMVYTADAIDKDEQAPISGPERDNTLPTAIRLGTLDGLNAVPLAYVNAVGGWLDPGGFTASYSPDRW